MPRSKGTPKRKRRNIQRPVTGTTVKQATLEQTGGSSADTSEICNMDFNRALLGNPPVEHKSSRNFSKEAASFGGVNAEFKRQFKGSITGNPGKPPAVPDGCIIL